LDFKGEFSFLPEDVGDTEDGEEGLFKKGFSRWEERLKGGLDKGMILAFAVEAAGGGTSGMVEVGLSIDALSDPDRGAATNAGVGFFLIG
jgi:hypothetical protein